MCASGLASLTSVYQFVNNNLDWIISRLNIPPMLPSNDDNHNALKTSLVLEYSKSSASSDNTDFNPLHVFKNIGTAKFNHVSQIHMLQLSYIISNLMR
jgi:hypothetical protein